MCKTSTQTRIKTFIWDLWTDGGRYGNSSTDWEPEDQNCSERSLPFLNQGIEIRIGRKLWKSRSKRPLRWDAFDKEAVEEENLMSKKCPSNSSTVSAGIKIKNFQSIITSIFNFKFFCRDPTEFIRHKLRVNYTTFIVFKTFL